MVALEIESVCLQSSYNLGRGGRVGCHTERIWSYSKHKFQEREKDGLEKESCSN